MSSEEKKTFKGFSSAALLLVFRFYCVWILFLFTTSYNTRQEFPLYTFVTGKDGKLWISNSRRSVNKLTVE